jgi:hypothetical protein
VRFLVIPLALCIAVVFAAISASSPRASAPERAKQVVPTRSLASHGR